MILFDTETNTIINDVNEIVPGIFVQQDLRQNRHICTDKQIGPQGSDKRFVIIDPEITTDIKNEKMIHESTINKKAKRENRMNIIIPHENKMPLWYTNFISQFDIEGGKQDDIRTTYKFDKKKWIEYLCDSSFPSSFIAGYTITKNLLSNPIVAAIYKETNVIKIADIGCGNGGATIGSITAIEEVLPHVENIKLDAYDYSDVALNIFRECLNAFAKDGTMIHSEFNVLKLVPKEVGKREKDTYTFGSFDNSLSEKEYDLVLCFKMVNELIASTNEQGFDGTAYYQMTQIATSHLSKKGFFILLDISLSAEKDPLTNKYKDDYKYGRELNFQIRNFVRENSDFISIIPIPCALIKDGCKTQKERCFQQRLFSPNDNKNRVFPATYNVITHKDLAQEILKDFAKNCRPTEFIISTTKSGTQKCCNNDGENTFLQIKDTGFQEGVQFLDGYKI